MWRIFRFLLNCCEVQGFGMEEKSVSVLNQWFNHRPDLFFGVNQQWNVLSLVPMPVYYEVHLLQGLEYWDQLSLLSFFWNLQWFRHQSVFVSEWVFLVLISVLQEHNNPRSLSLASLLKIISVREVSGRPKTYHNMVSLQWLYFERVLWYNSYGLVWADCQGWNYHSEFWLDKILKSALHHQFDVRIICEVKYFWRDFLRQLLPYYRLHLLPFHVLQVSFYETKVNHWWLIGGTISLTFANIKWLYSILKGKKNLEAVSFQSTVTNFAFLFFFFRFLR